jgi:hypothetical protein
MVSVYRFLFFIEDIKISLGNIVYISDDRIWWLNYTISSWQVLLYIVD